MKSFIQYTSESLSDEIAQLDAHKAKLAKLSPEKHIEKLNKTAQSIHNHVRSGGQYNHARGQDLIRRYDDHYEALKDNHPDAHRKWLKDKGSVSHSGSDLYA